MARDPMVLNGKIVPGTALHRLRAAAGENDGGITTVLAGDLADVCAACDPKEKPVGELRAAAAKAIAEGRRPGEPVTVRTPDLVALVDLAAGAN
jgi:hypothetical protein